MLPYVTGLNGVDLDIDKQIGHKTLSLDKAGMVD